MGIGPSVGHLRGGEHLETVLGWCADPGIRYVTVFLASSDNLRERGSAAGGRRGPSCGTITA
ncbi:undecaprenyl diphosphate synthase family protein [Saccharothrix australiensis]|uniref:undecaprenyl diphosphate synthase family protein n=1 Tax=Saccharothrix australiensis TaxID=2072 RepID=UPI000EB4ECC5|nr:undecaprenyl diphosphate synthase family protein [Saccharothrix australiensis]